MSLSVIFNEKVQNSSVRRQRRCPMPKVPTKPKRAEVFHNDIRIRRRPSAAYLAGPSAILSSTYHSPVQPTPNTSTAQMPTAVKAKVTPKAMAMDTVVCVRVKDSGTGEDTMFRIKRGRTKLKKVFDAYAARRGIDVSSS